MRAAMMMSDRGTRSFTLVDDLAEPVPGDDDLLVEVKASALNRGDFKRMTSLPSEHPPTVAGREYSGVVKAVGGCVSTFRPGDRVMGMCTAGFAELVVVDAGTTLPIPEAMSWIDAAAVPVAFLTEFDALRRLGAVAAGESVLIHSVGSGVGMAGVQLAKLMSAGVVLGTAGSDRKLDAARALGMDDGISYRANYVSFVMDATGGSGVDVLIDHLGGPYVLRNVEAMALNGRLVHVGRVAGAFGTLNCELLALRRLRLIGTTFRTRTRADNVELVSQFRDEVLPAFVDGRLRPIVDRVFPLADLIAAQEYMQTDANIGKIVIQIGALG